MLFTFVGTEKFIDNILNMSDEDPSLILGGVSLTSKYLYDKGGIQA